MTRLGAENLLAAAAVWVSIMLPNAAFGGDPSVSSEGSVVAMSAKAPVCGAADRFEMKSRA